MQKAATLICRFRRKNLFSSTLNRSVVRKDTMVVYVQYNGETIGLFNAGIGDCYFGIGGRMVTIYALYVIAKVRSTYWGERWE